jgi:phosphate:Na+ symporter
MAVKDSVVEKLTIAIGDYTSDLYKQNLSEDVANALPSILRISQYYDAISELAVTINTDKKKVETAINPYIQDQINIFYKHSVVLLNHANIGQKINQEDMLKNELNTLESEYQSLKSLLLRRGAEGKLSIAKMDKAMASISQVRRLLQQAVKAFIHFKSLNIDLTDRKKDPIDENITSV